MNVDLPAPFGPRSPVMPGGTVDRDVVQADDLAVPLRHVVGGDRQERSHDHLDAAHAPLEDERRSSAISASDHQQRHRPRRVVVSGQPENASPICARFCRQRNPGERSVSPRDGKEHAVDRLG